MTLKPFPWATLPKLSHGGNRAAQQIREQLAPLLALDRLKIEASSLLRQPVEARLCSIHVETLRPDTRCIPLEFQGMEVPCWVEAEVQLQIRVVEAVLGLPPGLSLPEPPVLPEVEGAWAAILLALLRRCSLSAAPHLGSPPSSGKMAVATFSVWIEREIFSLRIGLPFTSSLPRFQSFNRKSLKNLGSMAISLPLVIAIAEATQEDLMAMLPGAAWLPGSAWTSQIKEGRWNGDGWLLAEGAELGIRVHFLDSPTTTLVLDRLCESLSWEPTMSSPTVEAEESSTDLAGALAGAPVVVRVEVASITLEAQQWATLGVGDVVATNVRIGEPVTLRAGGKAFARGELCELEGELAVKILQRF